MGHNPVECWNEQIQWYSETNYFSELSQIVGKPTKFEWKIFPGFTTAGILNEIQKTMGELQCDPADFKGWIIFTWMFNDTVWGAEGNEMKNDVKIIRKRVEEYARMFLRGQWSFLGPGSEQKWHATDNSKPNGCSEKNTKFTKILSPNIPSYQCFGRGHLRSKAGGWTTAHFTASDDNGKLLLRMVMSVNQLNLYGAVADLIKELQGNMWH